MLIINKYKRFRDFQNNTNISLSNGYMYSAVDKVANSSIKAALFKIEYESVWKEGLIDKKALRDKRLSPLLSPYQLSNDLLKKVLFSADYFRFGFVRNPYSRLLSCYLDRIKDFNSHPSKEIHKALRLEPGQVTFKLFLEYICNQNSAKQNSHWRRQFDDILFKQINYDFIGKFENLQSDLNKLSDLLFNETRPEFNISGVNYSPSATNASEKLFAHYDSDLFELVYSAYIEDFETFGYEKL